MPIKPQLLARELAAAYAARQTIPIPPSGRDFIAPGESWTASAFGLDLPELTLRTTA